VKEGLNSKKYAFSGRTFIYKKYKYQTNETSLKTMSKERGICRKSGGLGSG
jgi:hypothetical protein